MQGPALLEDGVGVRGKRAGMENDRADVIAQWAFDTRPILGRFHLWLEDVETSWNRGKPAVGILRDQSFVTGRVERLLAMTAAVTALGTRLFGRYGEGAGLDKQGLNIVKKDADAISAYAMSEGLWYLSRHLPENHAIMVCLGEGLMPKAGETPEMGANPQLGFGRIYARPEIATWFDEKIHKLFNDKTYTWEAFYGDLKASRVTVWGAAIDTLENTSRFAEGREAGTMTVLHLFNQPLHLVKPYEGYAGSLILPRKVVETAAEGGILIDYRTPRSKVVEAIEMTYPGIKRENIHVWTLGGKSRVKRLEKLWKSWSDSGVHLVEDGWTMPSGLPAFTESGTYAPTYSIKHWVDEQGQTHLFLCDGYAASAEAMQAASLAPLFDLDASLSIFSSKFELPYDRERLVMRLDPEASDFAEKLSEVFQTDLKPGQAEEYAAMITEAKDAGLTVGPATLDAGDFFPEKNWETLALTGYMGPDPYSGLPGVEQISEDTYRVTVRSSCKQADKVVRITLRLEPAAQAKAFKPLLNRFLAGEDYQSRPVKISDSGRIRNELQTLCAEALTYPGHNQISLNFGKIPPTLIAPEHKQRLTEILTWYKRRHPIWFGWLELAE